MITPNALVTILGQGAEAPLDEFGDGASAPLTLAADVPVAMKPANRRLLVDGSWQMVDSWSVTTSLPLPGLTPGCVVVHASGRYVVDRVQPVVGLVEAGCLFAMSRLA